MSMSITEEKLQIIEQKLLANKIELNSFYGDGDSELIRCKKILNDTVKLRLEKDWLLGKIHFSDYQQTIKNNDSVTEWEIKRIRNASRESKQKHFNFVMDRIKEIGLKRYE